MSDGSRGAAAAESADAVPTRTFGVDEAGKGPVLGPMFAAAVVAPPALLPEGLDDSKRLTAARREELAAELRAAVATSPAAGLAVASVPPGRIDAPATDMNTLTVRVQAAALRAAIVDAGTAGESAGETGAGSPDQPLVGVVDAGDTDADRFGRRVADRLPDGVRVRAEHGADERHDAVAAASVLAKVARDAHVAALGRARGADVGSGYPGDGATRTYLREHVAVHDELPASARRSWSTSADVLAAAEQSSLGEF